MRLVAYCYYILILFSYQLLVVGSEDAPTGKAFLRFVYIPYPSECAYVRLLEKPLSQTDARRAIELLPPVLLLMLHILGVAAFVSACWARYVVILRRQFSFS